jgi:nucleotide-binding universal stress UspA family protein
VADEGNFQGRLHVLAVVEEPDTTRQCLIAAASVVAIDPKGILTALHIEVDPEKIRAAPEEISLQHLREPQEGSAHDRAIHIQRIFEFWLASNPSIHVEWRKVVGTIDATIVKEATGADIIVLCQPHNLDSADALHAGIFHSGKPVLFVPRGPLRPLGLRHLAIAWKDTPQANKAVDQARPWLATADRVSILTVDEPGKSRETERIERVMRELAIPFKLHHLNNTPDGHVAALLLDAALQLEADALVMGAYRFGQVLEWVFGGVTSEILQHSPLPVFLSH